MGDLWEEQRLERREQFRNSHRLRLDSKTSNDLVSRKEAIEALSEELLVAIKLLKSAVESVSTAPNIDSSDTLRQAYSKYVHEPAITNGDTWTESALNELVDLSTAFGHAMSAIMTINRCVISLNSEKLSYSALQRNVHKRALALMVSTNSSNEKPAYSFREGKIAAGALADERIEVELDSGELFLVRPDTETSKLDLLPIDLKIWELEHWKATGD